MIYAGFWRRFNAYGIDSLIVVVASWMLAQFLPSTPAQAVGDMQTLVDSGLVSTETDPSLLLSQLFGMDSFSWDDLALPVLVSAFYNILFPLGAWQSTPGKHWCKMKLVSDTGEKLTLLQSALRHLVSGVSMWPLGLGFLPILVTKQKTALHDMICQTRVIMR